MSEDKQPEAGRADVTDQAIQAITFDPAWPKGCEAASYSPTAAFETLSLMCPALIKYRGGWFRADNFKAEYADGFFEQTGGDLASVEYVVNHLHIDERLFGQAEPISLDVARAICEMLAYGWRNWARDRYGVAIRTSIICDEEQCEVSFRSKTPEEIANDPA